MSDENNLSGKIGLDTTDFKSGANQLKNQIKNIETSFRASAVTMEDWGNTSNGLKERVNSLREEIGKQKQEMEIYRQELIKVSSGSDADQKAADSLTNKMYSLQKQIGYNERDFQKYSEQLLSVDKNEKESSATTGQLGRSFMDMAEKSRQSTSKIKDHFNGLKSAIAGYIGGIVSNISFKEIMSDTDAAEKNLSQMDAVLKSTGDASSMTKEKLIELAEAQSKVTTYSAETTEKAENLMLTFTKVGKSVFPSAIVAAEDMATALHTDVSSATMQLGKALGNLSLSSKGTVQGLTALKKSGVNFTDAENKQIATMLKHNNVAGAQEVVIQELSKEFGGSATAAAKTLTGQIQIMQNNIKSSGVQIMGAILPIVQNVMPSIVKAAQGLASTVTAHKSQIVGAVSAGANVVKNIFGFVESHGTLVKGTIIGIISAVAAWKTAVLTANAVQGISNALMVASKINTEGLAAGETALAAAKGSTTLATMVQSAATVKATAAKIAHTVATTAGTVATKAAAAGQGLYNAALNANPIGIVITLVAALVAALVILFKHNKTFHDWVINAFNKIKAAAQAVVEWFKGPFINSFKTIFNGLKNFFVTIWNGIKIAVMAIITPFVNGIKNLFNNMKAGIASIFNGLKTFFAGVWLAIKNIILGPVLLIIDLVTGNFKKLSSDSQGIFNNLKKAFSMIWSGIKQVFTGEIQAIAGFCKGAWENLVGNVKAIFNGLKNFFSSLWNGIKNIFTSVLNGMLNFFKGLPGKFSATAKSIGDIIVHGFDSAIDFIKSLPSKMLQWGKDMIQGLINGIKSMIKGVGDAITGVGNKIRALIHCSRPDEGPLRDYETWMPDFIGGLAHGIESNKYKIVAAMRSLAANMSIAPTVQPAYVAANSAQVNAASPLTTASYTFYQYNSSPKALSPAEAARQTRNILRQAVLQSRR